MIVDVNANLSRWPFRRTPCDELPRLVETYRRYGIGQAWVGSLDGLFHRDLGGVNLRLAEACRQVREVELVAFGSVNPLLPDWPEELRRCHEVHGMPGIRVHPNYHGYRLDEPVFAQLLDLAAARKLVVQVVMRMDDIRVQHPLMRIADVDSKPLPDLVRSRPNLRAVVLNGMATVRGPALQALAAVDRLWFEIAMQEGVGGVAALAKNVRLTQVLFGSHLPLYSLESAVLKMQEAELDARQRQAIESGNARRLLTGGK